MDNNDNDFQSQGFHLGSEDNSKFPPLQSYALPKFDFDENLQLHLRFDSLPDTEVFLGLQNQENNWIEDFSRGSGVGFDSNTAESCSILRHNNVWSEAASSESVEMLLKSVGQDVSIGKQIKIQESNVCDGLVGLNTQMDLTMNHDSFVPSKEEVAVDTIPTLPPDKCPQRLLTLGKYSAEGHYAEGMPITQKDDKSRYEKLIDSGQSSVDSKFVNYVNVAPEQCSLLPKATPSYIENLSQDNCSSATDEMAGENLDGVASESMEVGPSSVAYGAVFSKRLGNMSRTGICQIGCRLLSNNTDTGDQTARSMPREASSIAPEGDTNGGDLDSVAFKSLHVAPSTTSMQNLVVGASDGCSEVVTCEKPEGLMEDILQKEKIQILEQNARTDGIHCVGQAAKGGTDNLYNFSSLAVKPASLVKIAISHDDVSSKKLGSLSKTDTHQIHCRVLSKDNELGDQAAGTIPEEPYSVATEGDGERKDLDRVAFKSMQVGPSATSMQELFAGLSDRCSEVVSCDSPGALMEGVSRSGNVHILQQGTHADDRHVVGPAAKSGSDNLDDFHSSTMKPGSLVQLPIAHEAVVSQKAGELLNTDNDGLVEGVFSDKCTESNVQIRGRELVTSSVTEEKLEGELVDNSNIDIGNLSSSVAVVCSPTGTIDEKQEIAEVKAGLDGSAVEGATAISLDLKSGMMERKMLNKAVENDGNNQDVTSNVTNMSSFEDDNLSQTCANRSVDIGSGDDHIVHSDGPIIAQGNSHLSTGLDDTGIEVGGCVVIKTSHFQSTSSFDAVMFESSSQHGNVYEAVPSEVFSEDSTPMEPLKKLDQTSLAPEEVVGQKDGEQSSPSSNFIQLNKASSKAISTQLCSSVLEQNSMSHAPSGSIPFSDSRHRIVCDAAAAMAAGRTSLSTTEGNSVDIPKSPICIKTASESGEELKPLPGAATSTMSQSKPDEPGVSSDKCEAAWIDITGKTTSSSEILKETIPSSLDGSSDNIVQNNEQHSEPHLMSGDGNGENLRGDLLNHCKASSLTPITLSGNTAQLHPQEDGSGNMNSSEPNCGSPTVVSCIKPSRIEKEGHGCSEKGSLDQNIPISDDAHKIDGMVDTVKLTAHNLKGIGASEEDKSFTFLVGPEKESGKGWEKISVIRGFESSQVAKESQTAPVLCQTHPQIVRETPHGKHQVSGDKNKYGTDKVMGEDQARLVSGSSAADKTVPAGRKRAKETSRSKQTTEKNGSPCSALVKSDGITSRLTQAEEIAQYGFLKGNHTKTSCVPTVQTSSLPDLNTSASPMRTFHQPFTILQQVQLRAQIFVYGSLIQGTAPDEACMISAFGDTSRDGGRSMWESVWCAAVGRSNNQKSTPTSLETPSHSQSGVRVSRCSSLPTAAVSSPASRSTGKAVASAIVNPSMSLSCTLLSPSHPYPTLQMRPYMGINSPWQSQASSGPGSWVAATQTSALGNTTRHSTLPIVEAVKVTSIRDSSAPSTSGMQVVSPSPSAPIGGPIYVPKSANLLIEENRKTPTKHVSADQKPKKRRKSVVAELSQISSVTQPQNEPASSIGATKHSATSECILPPSPPSSAGISGGLATISPIASSMHYNIVVGSNTDQRVIFSEETCSRIEQAKLHAEDAAAFADSAVRQSQGIWDQLTINKNSGLLSEVEAKLASAAVAAALAASVAKAAAAAAKVASDAALQAKLMADEALVMPKTGACSQDSVSGLLDGSKNLERISPASIMNSKDKTESSRSMIVAAREAARRRVEIASAAEKRAKNLDAVVKAAELAAVAVSQAGTVITMGDPIPLTLTELVEVGPEGYWKAQQNSTEYPVKANGLPVSGQLSRVAGGECPDGTVENLTEQWPRKNKTQRNTGEGKINTPKDLQKESVENQIELASRSQEGFGGQDGQKVSDVGEMVGVVSEMEVGLKAPSLTAQMDKNERHQPLLKEIDIKEGSLVEVVSDEDGLRGVWFSAKVQSLKDGKAYVCYSDLLQDEGRGRLKEWIPLASEGDKAPRIRIAHPMTAMRFEGTRKRRRAAMGNYVWSVGDRVDAWMRDGWWEGVIREKSNSDETKLTVHFPADGDSSTVRSWNLRPSLIWKDGQWIEWSRDKNCLPHEVNSPEIKRQKLGRHEIEIDSQLGVEGNKQSKVPGIEDSRGSEESRSLLNITGNVLENISDGLKMKRTGLQKEGSRVVFGIPKPGKKRKFMEVSKHYIADGVTKTNEGTDSVKFAKYLVPQGSLGWKNTSKVDVRGKRPGDTKPKVLNSGKDRTFASRSKSEQNGGSVPVISASISGSGQDTLLNVRTSVDHKENFMEKSSHLEEGPVLYSPQKLDSGIQSFNNASMSEKVEGALRGKVSVPVRKLAREGEKDSSICGKPVQDATEPRRSNRRIQPTSRLLEGLQSSFIISKIPSLSQGKGDKTQHRSASSRVETGNNYA